MSGVYVIRAGLYTCLYNVCDPQKSLNGTLAVNSRFQTRSTSRLIYRLALPLRAFSSNLK